MSELSPPLSETEVRNEISSLTASERTKLIKIARSYGRISLEEPDELVHEAICRILDGTRKWPRDLEKLRFLAGVIKSIAPMQTARHAFWQQVAPHAPGAVGPVAGKEAGADLHPKLFVTPAALTARSCQPGIEPAS